MTILDFSPHNQYRIREIHYRVAEMPSPVAVQFEGFITKVQEFGGTPAFTEYIATLISICDNYWQQNHLRLNRNEAHKVTFTSRQLNNLLEAYNSQTQQHHAPSI